MRSRVLYIVIALLLSTTSLYPQKDGTTPLVESAMEHLYQRPARWSGARYTTPTNRLHRLYASYSAENYGVWQYENGEDDSLNGWMNRLGVGYALSPVHSVEVGASFSGWDMKDMFYRFDASYLFNVTAFANRTEQPTKVELFMKLGVESYIDMMSEGVTAGASGAFRVKYNLSPSVGLYVEPKLAFVGGGGNLNTSLQNNFFMPSVSFGLTANIGQIRDNIKAGIDYRRELWSDAEYRYRIRPLFAIKSNLLFDAATLINAEIEVPIGDRYSVSGEWVFPWWVSDDRSTAVQMMSGQLEGRYWFGDRKGKFKLTGLFAGFYAGGGLYDYRFKDNGYQGEFFIASGISGGYAHALNKRGTFRMEYSLGFGYLKTNYRYYEGVQENKYFVWEHDGNYTWVGPTKAKVSFVWMINNRGGRR
ncbi:MAG: DUF3575 domain-containing protein [Rikenellaceae bacterium]